jgi:hypothetical protein
MTALRVAIALQWAALIASMSILCACGSGDVCPPGFRPGVYGCIITCANVPPDSGLECFMVRDGEVIDRPMDVASGDAADARDSADALDVMDVIDDVEDRDAAVDGDSGDAAVVVDPTVSAPRAIAPLSTSTVTSQRPTLRWTNGPTNDGALVQLSRTRDFVIVAQQLRASGDRVRLPSTLGAGVWFWRLRGRDSARNAEGTNGSPVWWFRVGARSADADRDTSWGSELDVNGDGFADVAVGSPGAEMGRGRVDVFYGGTTGVSATPNVTLRGVAMGDGFGASVSSAGDVNGDGLADLVVGASQADPAARMNAGTASVFLGATSGILITPFQVLEGASAGDSFGTAAAGAGDVNGDGYADVVVGAWLADPSGRMEAGAASVFIGGSTGLASTAQRVLAGESAGDQFGGSVASAGDVNGDGFGDIVVGAPFADPSARTAAGSASVFHGSAMGISDTASRTLNGTAIGDVFGVSVGGAGDVDGDGFADVVVAAWTADPGSRIDAGTVSVFVGSSGGVSATAQRVLEGVAGGDNFGVVVALLGDVNGDGFADLGVGASGTDAMGNMDSGAAHVFLGAPTGLPASANAVLGGRASGDRFGRGLRGGGDTNGDGFSELIVGAAQADPAGRMDAGTASVYVGSRMGVSSMSVRVLEGAAAGDQFGRALARSRPRPVRTFRNHHGRICGRSAVRWRVLEGTTCFDPLSGSATRTLATGLDGIASESSSGARTPTPRSTRAHACSIARS